jgi:hypothetical protein
VQKQTKNPIWRLSCFGPNLTTSRPRIKNFVVPYTLSIFVLFSQKCAFKKRQKNITLIHEQTQCTISSVFLPFIPIFALFGWILWKKLRFWLIFSSSSKISLILFQKKEEKLLISMIKNCRFTKRFFLHPKGEKIQLDAKKCE